MTSNKFRNLSNAQVAIYFDSKDSTIDTFVNSRVSVDRDKRSHPNNRDDQNFYFRNLYETLSSLCTKVDLYEDFINKNIKPTHVIFFDIPKNKSIVRKKFISESIKIVYLSECEVIKPWNYYESDYKLFDYVLTWSEEVINSNANAIHINNHFSYTDYNLLNFSKYHKVDKGKLCVLISSNKSSTHKFELYSYRKSIARWFSKKHPNDFDLFGYDWDKRYIRSPQFLRFLNRIPLYTDTGGVNSLSKCYIGEAENKLETMSRYKFSICFENAKSIPGYLTEKIFDSMIAGSIPIYYGDPNIDSKIPKSCYIDYENFNCKDDLYDFIKNISPVEYKSYINNIQNFLTSESIAKYSAKSFTDIFVGILNSTSKKAGIF